MAVLVRAGKLTKEEAGEMLEEDREQFTNIDESLVKRFEERIKG